MAPLKRYFLWFFLICFVMTCICGVIAALMPMGMGAVLTMVPYLVAMIWVLFKFLRQNRRAPTQAERKKITLGFSLIFWGYNLAFLLFGNLWEKMGYDPDDSVKRDFLQLLHEAQQDIDVQQP